MEIAANCVIDESLLKSRLIPRLVLEDNVIIPPAHE